MSYPGDRRENKKFLQYHLTIATTLNVLAIVPGSECGMWESDVKHKFVVHLRQGL